MLRTSLATPRGPKISATRRARTLWGILGVAPQLQPLEGMLLRRSTDVYPKELARDMREFFTSLLAAGPALAPLLFGGQHERVGATARGVLPVATSHNSLL